MQKQKFGVENIKKLVKFGVSFGQQYASSSKDGFQWTDVFGFVDELAQVPGLLKSLPEIKKEWQDMDSVERQEVLAYAKVELDLEDDNIEAKVEGAIELGVHTLNYLDLYKTAA